MIPEVLEYYKKPEKITNLDKYKTFIEWLTDDPNAICQVVQGLIAHDSWIGHYGENYNVNHEYSQKTAYMEDLLDKVLEIDSSNLSIPRHPRDRVIACCREFATLMCAFLRAKGIPARSRCGFAIYFGWDGTYEDHWICEYWNGNRWVKCDPQLDPFQQSSVINWALKVDGIENKMDKIKKFNPHDLKHDEFITAGEAWKLCRQGKANPQHFGISCPIRPEWGIDSLFGLWFVRGQLLRDFASLNKVETVPYLVRICKGLDWKPWHLVYTKDSELTDDELTLLDKIAELTTNVDANLCKIREAYLTNSSLTVPDEIILR